jgi:hypothetical protein
VITKGHEFSGAVFSDCMRYRYRLWRVWNDKYPRACFVMMNPSTADEISNDPTIERRIRHVRRLCETHEGGPIEFGGVEVVNVFAWRETDSRKLAERVADGVDIVGQDNDEAIYHAARAAISSGGFVCCAWGAPAAKLGGRHRQVAEMLTRSDIEMSALRLNADGTPQHPLYLSYDLRPFMWRPRFDGGPTTVGSFVI